jgi:hypothetical protein
VIPLCVHPIGAPAIIRFPYIEKSWKLHLSSREILCQKVKIIYRKTGINCMKSDTDRGVTPGQGSTRIALRGHNILNITVHMAVSSTRDSGTLMFADRTDIAKSHCSQNFLTDGFSNLALIWVEISLTVKIFISRSLFPRYGTILGYLCFQLLRF